MLVSSGVAATYVCGTNVSCNGANDGSINLTVTGGADCVAYTFNWSNGATTEDVSNLTAGNYSVTITDANGCSTSSSFTLTEPALLVSSGVAATYVCGTNVSCNGANDGSINLTVTGGASLHSLHLQLEQRRNNRGCQQPDCWQLQRHDHRCQRLQHKQQLHAHRASLVGQLRCRRNLCLRNECLLQRCQ
ncbi:MAG: SprB repeat-containing protein [Bacteroidetes bacterium]|nr:SprB repeat-containing protein [Bacteroidota bacterium]